MIELLFINYNRLAYTKLALPALLADPTEEFCLTIWDNGSTDGTREYLSSVEDRRIVRKIFSEHNLRIHGAVNEVTQNSSAELFGIVFDDDFVTQGWTRPLQQAHADVPEFGMIGCWHFSPNGFDYERAKHKIQSFGRHQVLRHPWTGVGAGLVKVRTIRECGPLESSRTTSYWIRMAQKGYVNGYYYPLIYVEHMDYPWSKHFAYAGRFQEWLSISSGARRHGIRTLEDAKAWHEVVVRDVLEEPWEVKYHVGWRRKIWDLKERVSNLIKR
jgi:glycosyltransferase involved in cell wall biosynthesis